MEPSRSRNGIKPRSKVLRTHLAQGCTRETEVKHRRAQTQFKVTAAGCWDTEMPSVVPGESARRRPLAAGEHAASLLPLNAIFAFRLFPSKMKIPLEFLQVSENRFWCRSSVKTRWCKVNVQKWGGGVVPVFIPLHKAKHLTITTRGVKP